MGSRNIAVSPIAGALGAEIDGVDLSRELDDHIVEYIRQALLDHGVVFFRDQTITPQQQLDFAKRFGPIHRHPHVEGLVELPEVMEIVKNEDDLRNFGAGWHTDQMFLPAPALATILYAKELPAFGGDTLFANLYGAYDTLSEGMKAMAHRLKTVNLPDAGRRLAQSETGGVQYGALGTMRLKNADDVPDETEHPLVRTHPETGRKTLYIGLHTERFAGLSTEESRGLVDYFIDHATRPELTCRYRWRPGSLAMWDNRRVIHNAINDYSGQRRRMHRITIAGDAPY